jgi:hypothetical protein
VVEKDLRMLSLFGRMMLAPGIHFKGNIWRESIFAEGILNLECF